MPHLSYIDTCYLLMFIDENDKLRRDFDLIGKDITKKVSRAHPKLCVPMASLGETLFKAMEKNDEAGSLFTALNKLIASGFLTVRHLDSPDVFRLATSISEKQPDGRDSVSLMDAFILASAAVDSECSIFYTSDSKLLTSTYAYRKVAEYRSERSMPMLAIRSIDFVRRYGRSSIQPLHET